MRRVREIILAVLLAVIGVGMVGIIRSDAADDNPTRAEWIHDLVTVFQMEVEEDNYPDNYYSDLQATDSCYKDVMTATEFGLVDLDAGQAFDPDGAVTREFAVHTLNYCLGFQLEQSGGYTYTDVEAVAENARNDAQVALNRKWLALIDGKFEPNRAVTAAESTAMLSDAKSWTGALEVDDSQQNRFTYEEGVVEIPEVTSVEKTEAGAIIIYDTSVSLNKNDVFVIYSDGLPQAYKADTVTSEKDKVVVMATEQNINDVIQTADAQGMVDGDISQIQPAEGVTVQYTEEYQDEESTPENARAMGRASGTKKVKKATFTAKVGGNCKVKITLSGMKIKYKVNAIDDVSVVLSGDATIHATGSFNNGGMSTIPLGSLNIGGVANVRLDANVLVSGRIEADYVTGFSVGAQKKPYDDWRLVKEFKKKRFTICSEISMSTGLNASAKLTGIPLVSGDMSAEMGVTTDVTNITRPSGTPHTCTHILTYIYARAGAALTVGEGIVSKTFSKSVVVYDKKNSPVRTAYHYEDGVWKMPCSVDPDNFYYTKGDSRYGLNSSGYGMDDEGQPYQIFEYSLDDEGNATITKYHGNVYHIAVPEEIDGYKVVAIGEGAFKSNNSFSSVAIPNPIKEIGGDAFNKCTALTSVSLPKEFEVSGGVFSGCSSLSDVSFEDGIKTIPEKLFYNTGLVQIEIPETVTEIGGNAFAKCVNLRKVILHEGLEKIGGDAFSGCEKLNDITLPLSMNTLGGNAFELCTSLKKINIPKNMEYSGVIRPYMAPFYKCSSLCEIEFEPGITRIPDGLFAGCNGLTVVEIPDTVTAIYGSTWNGCGAFTESSISEVILPESIEMIGEHAFSSCNNLTEVKLPNSLRELCDNAFADCKALSTVSFPKDFDVTGLKSGAYRGPFDGCSSLSEVTFEEGIEKIPSCLFQGSGVTKTQIPDTVKEIAGGVFQDCTALKEAVIPDTVTSLGGDVFCGCTGLESVKYSKGLTEVPNSSFKNCTALGQIGLHDKITAIGESVFENCTSLKEIILPPHLGKLGKETFM